MWLWPSKEVHFDLSTISHLTYPFSPGTGPSTQVEIGVDRVDFSDVKVTFVGGLTQGTVQTVSAAIIDDELALEDDKLVHIDLIIASPRGIVSLGVFPTTVVTIVDNDCKSATITNFLWHRVSHDRHFLVVQMCFLSYTLLKVLLIKVLDWSNYAFKKTYSQWMMWHSTSSIIMILLRVLEVLCCLLYW